MRRPARVANLRAPFTFRDPGPLCDGDLTLSLDYRSPADPGRGWIPAYHFSLRVGGRRVGGIELRVDLGGALDRSTGHVGYFVEPAWRGRGYAARAGRLLLPLARAHGLDPLWILCAVDNAASRRTCERLGGVLVAGEGGPCRYRLDLG
ncbi:hypothetical protein tb265_13140 [Gemmatimonadetes bacterium T265]|nr:hypothetical protein tb265_13140 [Gemmatimonadetes bacterium T265]